MSLIEKLRNQYIYKYSFGKNNEWNDYFSRQINSFNMNTPGFGFNIPGSFTGENKIRAVFMNILNAEGIFTFNISSVDIKRAMQGFSNFEEAAGNNMITEWELFMIFTQNDYFERTVFHNAANEFIITKRGVKIKWN